MHDTALSSGEEARHNHWLKCAGNPARGKWLNKKHGRIKVLIFYPQGRSAWGCVEKVGGWSLTPNTTPWRWLICIVSGLNSFDFKSHCLGGTHFQDSPSWPTVIDIWPFLLSIRHKLESLKACLGTFPSDCDIGLTYEPQYFSLTSQLSTVTRSIPFFWCLELHFLWPLGRRENTVFQSLICCSPT